MQQPGILAIWNNVAPGREAEFDAWFQSEHLVEPARRTRLPVRAAASRQSPARLPIFNSYLVELPAVNHLKPYLAPTHNPTPMTKKIMSGVFIDMNRTICHRTLRRGPFRGAYAVTVRFDETPDESALAALLDKLVVDTKIAGGEIWIAADPAGQPVSMEEKLRGGDKKIKGALMVDTLREKDAEALGARLAKEFSGAEVGVFRVLCQLGRGDL